MRSIWLSAHVPSRPHCSHRGGPAVAELGNPNSARSGVAEEQCRLAGWVEGLGAVGAEGRAGLVEIQGAEHVAMEEAVLAAASVLAPALRRALAPQAQCLGDFRCLPRLDQL